MEDKIYTDATLKMEKTIIALKTDLNKVRTGRASLALLDDIRIDYYGTSTLLNQMATLAVPEPRLITIQPWDPTTIGEIEKAILKSDLGLTPMNDGKIIRINIPRLTEERRKELVKVVKKMGEATKVALRNIRRDANDQLKGLEKNKKLSQDLLHQWMEKIQTSTDKYIERVDGALSAKEKEILEI
ncbi:MAG: ribosome recycling factor [Deltaproteobacteria bacterium]|nr:ribosome recycling factor [Deltaproteobacteria bacterium]MBM4322097.1 ribosome recycling factor [Deltaproteobacteria bacterium]